MEFPIIGHPYSAFSTQIHNTLAHIHEQQREQVQLMYFLKNYLALGSYLCHWVSLFILMLVQVVYKMHSLQEFAVN